GVRRVPARREPPRLVRAGRAAALQRGAGRRALPRHPPGLRVSRLSRPLREGQALPVARRRGARLRPHRDVRGHAGLGGQRHLLPPPGGEVLLRRPGRPRPGRVVRRAQRSRSGRGGALAAAEPRVRARRAGAGTGVAAGSVGYPDLRRAPSRRSFFMRTTLKKGIGRGAAGNGNGHAVLPPGALTPVTLYRQPPPPQRGAAAQGGRLLATGGVARTLGVVWVVGGFYLWAHESVALLRPTSAEGQQTQARLDPPKSAANAAGLGYDHLAGDPHP